MRALISVVFGSLLAAASASAQTVTGDWQGTLVAGPAEIRVVVHITRSDKGELAVTMDSPDQGARGIPTTSVSLTDTTLKFEAPQIAGAYEGKLNAAGTAINGTWSQAGNSLTLDFARAAAVQERKRVLKGSDIDGDWGGSLQNALSLIVHVTTFDDGMSATMDVPDQGAKGLPVTSIARAGSSLQFAMKQLAATFAGALSADLQTMTGTWSQAGNSLPLVLTRLKKP